MKAALKLTAAAVLLGACTWAVVGDEVLLDGIPVAHAPVAGFVVACLATGLLLGNWRAPALVFGLVVTSVLLSPSDTYDAFVRGFFAAAVGVLIAAVGTVAAVQIARRRPTIPLVPIGFGLLGLSVLPYAAAASVSIWPIDGQPEDPLVLDLRAGTYDGFDLRSDSAAIESTFGGQPAGANEPVYPTAHDSLPASPFYSCGAGRFSSYRYEHHSFLLTGDRICLTTIADPDAETPEGVGIGDSLEIAKRRYPEARCETNRASGEHDSSYSFCIGVGAPGELYYRIAGDPIEVIEVGTKPFRQ